jgi:phage host-nuclease inhibitor protein Gam
VVSGAQKSEVLNIGQSYCSIGRLEKPSDDVIAEAQFKADIEGLCNEIKLLARMEKDYSFENGLKETKAAKTVAGLRKEMKAIRSKLIDLSGYEK